MKKITTIILLLAIIVANGCKKEKENIETTDGTLQIVTGSGSLTTFILKEDHTLWSTGDNTYGALGNNTDNSSYKYINVASDVKQVKSGFFYTLILKNDNSLWACGDNVYGQLGNGTRNNTNYFVRIMSDVKDFFPCYSVTMVLKQDNTLWAVGHNALGVLGIDSYGMDRDTTNFIKMADNVIAASGGFLFTYILKSDNTLWSCGFNNMGQLGDSTNSTNFSRPNLKKVANDVIAVSCGHSHTLILKSDNTVWGCGSNQYNQLSFLRSGSSVNYFVKIFQGPVSRISAGHNQSLLLKSDGTLWACGRNEFGQLGDSTIDNIIDFKNVADSVSYMYAGYWHSVLKKKDNSLWVCGSNREGQFGDGTYTNSTTWKKITSP